VHAWRSCELFCGAAQGPPAGSQYFFDEIPALVRHALRMRTRLRWIMPTLAALAALPLWANDWPQWRGPDRNGISTETGWLDQWPASGPVIAWKAQVGLGFSSFVVAGGRVFTAGHADEKDTVFCFEAATGKL